MLQLFKRWLGWDASSEIFDFDVIERAQPRSATGNVLSNRPRVHSGKPTIDTAGDPARQQPFDPYNTGMFDRSASWERINRAQR